MGKKSSKELETEPLFNSEEFEDDVNQAGYQYHGVITCSESLSKSISFPPYKKDDIKDKRLSEKMKGLLNRVTPESLGVPINLKDDRTCYCISRALHHLVQISTTGDPVKMLKSICDCVKEVAGIWGINACTDNIMKTLIFIVLMIGNNLPTLYSDMRFIAAFLELNKQLQRSIFAEMISDSENVTQNGSINYCFTNLSDAVEYINDEIGNTLNEGVHDQKIGDEYYAEFDPEFMRELEKPFKKLPRQLQELKDLCMLIKENHKEDMLLIADTLDTHNTNLHISKAIGSSFAVAGGIISIIGFGLMFTTFGVSAILIPVGAAVGGAGGLTACISGFVEYGIKKSNAKKIQIMRKEYESKLVGVFKTMEDIGVLLKLRSDEARIGLLYSIIGNIGKIVTSSIGISEVSLDVIDGVNSAFHLASSASRSLAITGVVFSAALLPIDVAFLGISIKALSTKQRCQHAEGIRKWLNQDLPSHENISTTLDLLKKATLEYGRRDSNKIDVEKLNEALENGKKIINSH